MDAEERDDIIESPSRVVLPAVPPLLSEAYCLLNYFTPGLGTAFASVSCCCARTRGMTKAEVAASVFVGLLIALLQLLLTPFLLIGWIWSCFWGVLITAQSDAYYKPRDQPPRVNRGILPRPLSAPGFIQTHPEAPPPYTFYDDYFQRGRTPPPSYSPPEQPIVVTTQPILNHALNIPSEVYANAAFQSENPPDYATCGRVSNTPLDRVDFVTEGSHNSVSIVNSTVPRRIQTSTCLPDVS